MNSLESFFFELVWRHKGIEELLSFECEVSL
jgi:hypothetical protein